VLILGAKENNDGSYLQLNVSFFRGILKFTSVFHQKQRFLALRLPLAVFSGGAFSWLKIKI